MNISKAASTVGIGASIVVGSLLAVSSVNAFGGGSEVKQAERVSALAERFNLDETEVKAYFEEQKAERQADRDAKRAKHISGLVEAGTLTQTQADELMVLKDEAKASMQELKESGAEKEEFKALMEENRSKIETWANENNINLEDIRPEGKEKGRRGHFGPKNMNDTE